MKKIKHIAVIGGGGRTGRFLVEALLRQDYQLTLLLRHPEQFHIQHPYIKIVQGDVLDPQAVEALVTGCDAVMSVVGQRKGEPLVSFQATVHILDAIQKQPSDKLIRYISLAGLNVDTPADHKGPETQQATNWMRDKFSDIHADRQNSYSILHESPAEWVLIRVPMIEYAEARREIKVDLYDCPGSKVTAGDIAELMILQLMENKYLRKAPFLANV